MGVITQQIAFSRGLAQPGEKEAELGCPNEVGATQLNLHLIGVAVALPRNG